MRTILAADDDPVVLSMIKKDLEQHGYRTLTANNGNTALRLARSEKPDLIILDVAMPLTSGLKAFETLRSQPETERIPVIFMTGMPSGEVFPTVEKGTRVAHLKKPVDLVELLSLIEQFLERYPK